MLTVGKRAIPYALIRVADRNPVNLLDVLPSDGLTKIVLFAGPLVTLADKERLERLEKDLLGVLDTFGGDRFKTIVVLSAIGEDTTYFDVPTGLRKDWTRCVVFLCITGYLHWLLIFRILVDAASPFSDESGGAYTALGVPVEGQLAVIRPDGYLGLLAGLNDLTRLDEYLKAWMI